MRIIHTADWHLGQYFYAKSRAAEHQAFLSWLIAQVELHRVDAVIIAGDVFDNGSPPSYAREMFNRFVVELRRTACQLVVLGGNHDSVATLNESRALLACLDTQVIAGVEEDIDRQIIVLRDRRGEPGAVLCAVPFLRPRDVLRSQSGQSGEQKQQALLDAIAQHYLICHQAACRRRDELDARLPIVATGHLTAVGAAASESVRDIYVGSLDAFPAHAFPPADYIALGHIHRAQRVADSEHIRYSGSPIPLSFDELNREKSVCLIDFARERPPEIATLPVPVTQPMRLIRGDLEEIEHQLAEFRHHKEDRPVWLDIEVVGVGGRHDLQQRIQELTASLPVEVLLLRRVRERLPSSLSRQRQETLDELAPRDVFERRLAQETELDDASRQRLGGLFSLVLDDLDGQERTV